MNFPNNYQNFGQNMGFNSNNNQDMMQQMMKMMMEGNQQFLEAFNKFMSQNPNQGGNQPQNNNNFNKGGVVFQNQPQPVPSGKINIIFEKTDGTFKLNVIADPNELVVELLDRFCRTVGLTGKTLKKISEDEFYFFCGNQRLSLNSNSADTVSECDMHDGSIVRVHDIKNIIGGN